MKVTSMNSWPYAWQPWRCGDVRAVRVQVCVDIWHVCLCMYDAMQGQGNDALCMAALAVWGRASSPGAGVFCACFWVYV